MTRLFFTLFAATVAMLAQTACSGNTDNPDQPACACTVNGFSFKCSTSTCVSGELAVCSDTAVLSSGGACTETPTKDGGTQPLPDAGKTDAGPRDAGPPPPPACDKTTTFTCGAERCKTGSEYCNAVLASASKCRPVSDGCAKCSESSSYISFVAVNSCRAGKRAICFDGPSGGGQMTWGCN
jgi:hypothetical protein